MGEDGYTIFVPCNVMQTELINAKDDVIVEFDDGRSITAAQRRKAYVLLKFIAEGLGYTPLEVTKELTKYMFIGTGYSVKDDMFSLSDCSRTEARLYITFLIEFCLINAIPCGEPLWKLAEDIPRYVWGCLVNKRCAVCGKKPQLHHVDSVGQGRNRKEICHIGMRCLPLCDHHHREIHNIGRDTFLEKYHLEPVEIDEQIADIFKLRKRGKKNGKINDH